MPEMTGGCQCGAVRYEIIGRPRKTVVCHCEDCRRQSSSAFGFLIVVGETEFRLTEGTLATFESRAASGRRKVGAFCRDCGSRIHHAVEYRPGTLSVRAGTLDDPHGLMPDVHLWTKAKLPWVVVPEGVEQHETQPE